MKRPPLPIVLVVAAGLLVAAATFTTSHDQSTAGSTLGASSALYCAGIGSAGTPLEGQLTLVNSSSTVRHVQVNLSPAQGTTQQLSPITLDGDSTTQIPVSSTNAQSAAWGATLNADGPGLYATETVTGGGSAPCESQGVTNWYAAGLTTNVGSPSTLTLYNPTDTPAVVNVTTLTPTGFAAPQPWQGLAVAGHATTALSLRSQIVSTSNFGLHVKVLRGLIVPVVSGQTGSAGWLSVGDNELASRTAAAAITTDANASARIEIANPTANSVEVTATVSLGQFQIAPLTTTVAPFSSGGLTVTPNSAIPAAGAALITFGSSSPVAWALVAGSAAGKTQSSWVTPLVGGAKSVALAAPGSLAALDVTNVSGHAVQITTTVAGHATKLELSSQQTTSLLAAGNGANLVTVSAPSESLVLTAVPLTTPRFVVGETPLVSR